MQPLHELLNRIRWDPAFAKGKFALGYIDRVAQEEKVVSLGAITVDERAGMFSFVDDEGMARRIPLHRVRTVYEDGVIVWRRPDPRGWRLT
ncbi:MAG TPA: DUF504 domain-containing protein [Vicinamibacterales bacterium]|nr:DUF504 domain-containing protein [Vicinamibacterales bacterium]